MAAELVGGAIVSTFVQMTIDNLASRFMLTIESLASLFQHYFRGRKFNKELLSKLKVKLLCIDVLADDAEQKQFRDSRVRVWLLKAKDVVFDAEDLLAEIDFKIFKCEMEAESKTIVGQVTSFLKSSIVSSFDIEMEWMEQILADIEDLLSQSEYLGLKKDSGVGVGSGLGSNESWKLSSTSLPSASDIYGRDDDKENIINWITSHTDNKLSILSIVGMGGLGKTTLAQLVYNDSKTEGKFDVKAWVCVSDDFDVFKLTRTILEKITGLTDDSRDLEMIHTRLKQNLSGKKFLLVLDDVWNEDWHKWELVQKPLVAFGVQGSRILVTTRSNEVASTMRSKEHNLKELQQDHCWQLFTECAFPDGNLQPISGYNEVGMKIVEKCKGLPLALKSMGSLLHNKSSVSEWQSVLESELWQLKDNNILPALALSYLHLPPHLKRCFAYCALFPKDYEFDKEGLIQLWMGEKFLLLHEQNRSPENVGEQIFNDLLSRSFFQQSRRNRDGFVMHDLHNDLAKYVCGHICFRLGVDQAKSVTIKTRHFSFSTHQTKDFDGFGSLHDDEKLRTFMPIDRKMNYLSYGKCWQFKVPIANLLSKFKFLRVLSFSGCDNLKEVPQSVRNLKHLCSLDLSKTDIDKLPESICSLFNLQILKLNNCRHLKELPSNLHRLTNLHRLEFKETKIGKVPPHLGKLKNLQVCMSWFDVGKSTEFTMQQLGELNVHGSLKIGELQNIENPLHALAMDLRNKTHLVELELEWGQKWPLRSRNLDDSLKEREEIVIENLQPSKQLKKFSVRNYGGIRFPSWLFDKSLSNVVSLKLDKCQSCRRLPSLGLLPFLKELEIAKLDGIVIIDADVYGSEPFSFTSLETLKFSCMKEWERWECEGVTGAFPRLQHLSIENCPKLKGNLPMQNLHLKELKVYRCEKLETCAPKTQSLEIQDSGKLQLDWAALKRLTIAGHNMEALLFEMIGNNRSHTFLEELDIYCYNHEISDGYDSLKTFPLDLFPTLNSLTLTKFPGLQMISLEHAHNHLKKLRISECPQLESLPKRMDILLSSLENLEINDCPKVEWVPGGYLPSKLKKMNLKNCSKLIVSLKGAFGANPSLKMLDIRNLDAETFPDEGLLPLSLTSLLILNCPSLKNLEYKGLCHPTSLKQLRLFHCPKLECLPEEGLPKSISYLEIFGCPLLKQRCKELTGEDWGKIAHIQHCSSSSHIPNPYDVFVSFRGEDTRNNFTGFLFEALCRNGIDAFKDEEDLKKGESIAPELLQAIEGSRIFVVIFSKNYASSTWCLRELAQIYSCIETSTRCVLPIFYDVDPSEVRKQSGCYKKAFAEHEERFGENINKMEEVQRWREALTHVSSLSGWHIRNKPQHAEIKQIVQTIINRLGPKFSSLPNDDLVGMQSRVEKLIRLLCLESNNNVRIVGISGMGGIGKSTLARALYERISYQYNFSCFIDDVSKVYRDSGTLGVQKQLLTQSLNEKNLEICTVSEGKHLILTRLHSRALLVFDNVDQVGQLKMFIGSNDSLLDKCLHGGSRIIIISRDERVLRTHGVDDIYQVQPLNDKDAIKLFCRNAFKSNHLVSDYKEFTNVVLSYAKGHPLAIEVMGSSLFGRNVSRWRSALAKLRERKIKNIINVLRICFDELDNNEKEIFLDIACFLNKYEEQHVNEILNFRGFHPEDGLQVLIEKSLITIEDGRIHMHGLLVDLGRTIVREKSPKEPRNWSRLWEYQDLLTIMSNNMAAENLEAIVLDRFRNRHGETTMSANTFSNMSHLKLLVVDHVDFSGSLDYLPNELGYLSWIGYPFECLPPCFQPYNLVELSLMNSNIKQLWEDTKPLHNLRRLDLSKSENLIKIPDFGKAVNLEWLNLKGCIKIKNIDQSIGFLRKLIFLNLEGCTSLLKLPHFGENLNLETLNLKGCIKLEQIHPSIGLLRNLTFLNLKNCRSLRKLPHFREDLNLEMLNLERCTQLQKINPSIGHLRKLTFLNLKYCESLVSLPSSILGLNSLKYLNLSGCSNLIGNLLIEELRDVEHSKKLHSNSTLSIMKRWLYSRAHKDSVRCLLPSVPNFPCMRELHMSFCNLVRIPDSIGNLSSLERLNLMGNNFTTLPSFKDLSKLYYLDLQYCKQLKNLPELSSQTDLPLEIYTPPWPIIKSLVLGPLSSSITTPPVFIQEAGLKIFNCPKLVDNEKKRCTSMTISWMLQILQAQFCIRPWYLLPIHPQVSSIIPGSEIPRWFNNHVGLESLLSLSSLEHDYNCMGVVCCVVFRAQNRRGTVSALGYPQRRRYFTIPVVLDEYLVTDKSDHMCLVYLDPHHFIGSWGLLLQSEIEIMAREGFDVEVKKFGYRWISEEDIKLSNFRLMMDNGNSSALNEFLEIE